MYDNIGLGYLTAPSLSPGHILRPSSLFVLPAGGPEGSRRIDFDVHWANIWNYEPDEYLIDGEWVRSNIRFSYALKDTLSLGVAVPIIGRTGGFADPLIENFHNTFHFGNANRDEFPQNRYLISAYTNGGSRTIVKGDSWGIGDVSLFMAARISEGNGILPALLVQGQISLPSGDEYELRGLGAPSIAISTVASKRLGGSPFILFGGLGFQYCPADDINGLELHNEEWAGLAGLEYQYTPALSLIAQCLVSSPVAKDYYAFSDPTHEVSVGFKWRVTRHTTMEFAVVENILIFNNSADIGVHLCFGRNL
ncbi:MAG: DUF3187 family protein [Kiritimatiellia bacterium]